MRPASRPDQPAPGSEPRDPDFPYWSAAEGGTFRDLVAAALAARGHRVVFDGETLRWPESAPGSDYPTAMNLQNLARRCAGDPRGATGWPDAVSAYVRSLDAIGRAPGLPHELDSEAFRAALRLRLVAEDAVDRTRGFGAGEDFAPGVCAVFALDFPHGVSYIPDTLLDRHGGAETLRATALRNTLTRERPDTCHAIRAEPADEAPLGTFLQLSGATQDVASMALDLAGCARAVGAEPGPDGLLFAVPSRHLLLLHAIRDATCVDSMNALAVQAIGAFQHAPGPITPDAFWWRDGRIEVVSRYRDERHSWPVPGELDEILLRHGRSG